MFILESWWIIQDVCIEICSSIKDVKNDHLEICVILKTFTFYVFNIDNQELGIEGFSEWVPKCARQSTWEHKSRKL